MISKIDFVISIVILIVILWYFGIIDTIMKHEGYTSCPDCAEHKLPQNSIPVLNPFVWPYSATPCIDSLYEVGKSIDDDKKFPPLGKSQNTPDHAEKE